MRSRSNLVRRTDHHIKPRAANRTLPASLSAAAYTHSRNPVVRSEAERTGLFLEAFRFCNQMNAMLPNAGAHLFKESLSAQPAGTSGFTQQSVSVSPSYWMNWHESAIHLNIFSFPPCTAHFLFDVSKRKWGVYSGRRSLHPCGDPPHPDRISLCGSRENGNSIPCGIAVHPPHQSGAFDVLKRKYGNISNVKALILC